MNFKGLELEVPGHSTLKVENSKTIYVDPWSKAIDGSPKDADIVIVTHDDFDHYDPEGIEKVSKEDTEIVLYEKIDGEDLERVYTSVGSGEELKVNGIGVKTFKSYNKVEGSHVDEDGNPFHSEGEVIGVLLEVEGKEILFTSDTDPLEHYRKLNPDVLVLPIGGHFTMNKDQAADLARETNPELVLPVHYDTFGPIETDQESFKSELETEGFKVELLKE